MKLWPANGGDWMRLYLVVVETLALSLFLLSVGVNTGTQRFGRTVVRSLRPVQYDIFLPPELGTLVSLLFVGSLLMLALSVPIFYSRSKMMAWIAGMTAVVLFLAAFV